MPTLSFTVSYDGDDPQILQALGRMATALAPNNGNQPSSKNGTMRFSNSGTERIAVKFAGFVSLTPRLKTVMESWLQQKGTILLSELVKVSGVKKQHDYAGIGSALTRLMKKAGGGKDWYDGHQDIHGNWIYQIADNFVEPLRHAFRV